MYIINFPNAIEKVPKDELEKMNCSDGEISEL